LRLVIAAMRRCGVFSTLFMLDTIRVFHIRGSGKPRSGDRLVVPGIATVTSTLRPGVVLRN
jgi:hypothetical protein